MTVCLFVEMSWIVHFVIFTTSTALLFCWFGSANLLVKFFVCSFIGWDSSIDLLGVLT